MSLLYLQPIDSTLASKTYKPQQLGSQIRKHTFELGVPDLDEIKVAFFSVETAERTLHEVRKSLYALYRGNWNFPIADLGILYEGHSTSDTYFAVRELVNSLIKQNITPVVIGGKRDLTYPIYRSFDTLEQMVNLVAVNPTFDFGDKYELFSETSYLSRILSEEPINLFDFTNLGYQSYYVAQEELDLLEKMCFDTYRLGIIVNDLPMIEPTMRDADIVSITMNVIQARDIENTDGFVNGFSNREICAISRYAGISSNVQVYGIFDIPDTGLAAQLTGQMFWYFCEGFNFRVKELPLVNDNNYIKYIVPVDDIQIEFFKSVATGRWWMKAGSESFSERKPHLPLGLIPCNHKEYLDATQGVIPERWWKAYRKSI
ncbi:formimidoylglutamase [Capnocytophaga canis]|uniref:formimidoylglutamase n=1 Tax=Capnocytophaga canis TaxID=1848903 RepID=UPI001562BA41|nr:formimidoylglutamase [Capnocytophaga canis]